MGTDVVVQLVAKRLLACPLDRHLLQHIRLVVHELARAIGTRIFFVMRGTSAAFSLAFVIGSSFASSAKNTIGLSRATERR